MLFESLVEKIEIESRFHSIDIYIYVVDCAIYFLLFQAMLVYDPSERIVLDEVLR